MAAHHLDAIASPTNPPAWTTDCERGDEDVIPSSTPAAVAGYPSVSVPSGSVGELPVGLLLMAGYRQDAELLSPAAVAERELYAWRAPRYLPIVGPDPHSLTRSVASPAAPVVTSEAHVAACRPIR